MKNIINFLLIAFCARVYTSVIFYQLHNNEVSTAYAIILVSIVLVFVTMKPNKVREIN